MLKLGGELLESAEDVARMARGIAELAGVAQLTVVHGGGREIDAALAAAGIPKRQVDGLRVTDEATLGVVVGVLAGSINTRLVAGVRRAGGGRWVTPPTRRGRHEARGADLSTRATLWTSALSHSSRGGRRLLADLRAAARADVACVGATSAATF